MNSLLIAVLRPRVTEVVYVLDASAVLAAFFDEPGAEAVADRMDRALLCSVNYSEVVSKLVDRGTPAQQIVEIMGQLDVELVTADRELAMRAGLLRAETRGKGLSLGDRYCLALAASRNAVAVTADRAWADLDIGLSIEMVR
jgi:PIN domain nuclease of toxin-antitoxin system